MKESEIKKAILTYLKYQKIYAWNNRNVGMWNEKGQRFIPAPMLGISDILGILPDGKFLAIEVKAEKGKPTDNQICFIENILQYNGVAFLAYSLDDVIDNLTSRGYLK